MNAPPSLLRAAPPPTVFLSPRMYAEAPPRDTVTITFFREAAAEAAGAAARAVTVIISAAAPAIIPSVRALRTRAPRNPRMRCAAVSRAVRVRRVTRELLQHLRWRRRNYSYALQRTLYTSCAEALGSIQPQSTPTDATGGVCGGRKWPDVLDKGSILARPRHAARTSVLRQTVCPAELFRKSVFFLVHIIQSDKSRVHMYY